MMFWFISAQSSTICKQFQFSYWIPISFFEIKKTKKYYFVAIAFVTACKKMKKSLLEQLSPYNPSSHWQVPTSLQ